MESYNQLKIKYKKYKDAIDETKLDIDRHRERISKLEEYTK